MPAPHQPRSVRTGHFASEFNRLKGVDVEHLDKEAFEQTILTLTAGVTTLAEYLRNLEIRLFSLQVFVAGTLDPHNPKEALTRIQHHEKEALKLLQSSSEQSQAIQKIVESWQNRTTV